MGDLSTNFSRHEFACNCKCGFDTVDYMLLVVLEDVRDNFRSAVTVTSGCRCHVYNASPAILGSTNSQHLQGRAADIVVSGVDASEVQRYLKNRYPDIFGIGTYQNFTHIDTASGPARRWGGV